MRVSPLVVRSARLLQHRALRGTTKVDVRVLQPHIQARQTLSRLFSCSTQSFKGLQPDTSDPKPPNNTPNTAQHVTPQPASVSEDEYHELADQYIEDLQRVLEEKAEDVSSGFEIEYAAGVLNLTTPQGTYVINKQPPNKQIWLSSPISGPKRYDWVITGAGQNTKEGTETEVGDDGSPGGGKWLYLRDGSSLSDLFKDELKIEVGSEQEAAAVVSADMSR